jgi:hypothetical protein
MPLDLAPRTARGGKVFSVLFCDLIGSTAAAIG